MSEQQASAIADALSAETWQSGGGIWLVLIHRPDGKLVVLSEEAVCEYDDDAAFESGRAAATISFC